MTGWMSVYGPLGARKSAGIGSIVFYLVVAIWM